jgi:hypothetical protein
VQRCPSDPAPCRLREHIAPKLTKPRIGTNGKLNAQCPACGGRGFTISPPTQVQGLRNIWACQSCRADALILRDALIQLGIREECLGTYGRPRRLADRNGRFDLAAHAVDALSMVEEIKVILADPKLRTPADLRLRIAEVVWGDAPEDFQGFVAFAERAGISKSKAYTTAARWGRRSATSRLQDFSA